MDQMTVWARFSARVTYLLCPKTEENDIISAFHEAVERGHAVLGVLK